MLTKRQKEVLDFIRLSIEENGYAPSLEEIKSHLKLSSVSTAHHHVSTLEASGYLKKLENHPRGIEVYDEEEMVILPLLGRIAAGQPIEAIEQKETIAIPRNKLQGQGEFYALKVSGNSMVDENIDDGDTVIIKNQSVANDGQKVVALIDNNQATLKKLYRENNRVRLQPANTNIQPMLFEPSRVSIQGVVVDIIKTSKTAISPTPRVNERLSEQVEKEESPPKPNIQRNAIICKDCIEGLISVPSNSIDACITDPPYNYEFIGHKWDASEILRRTERVKNSNTLIKHIPYGSGLAGGVRNARWYEKNRENILDYQKWTSEWGREVFRTLKPGAYILVFNSSRTVAHVQIALENVGFYARDILVWRKNSGIPKGLNFTKKLAKEGVEDYEKWEGWHSCLRNEWEAIVMLQKPLVNNYLQTVKDFGIGLLHAENGDGKFLSNIFESVQRDEKEDFNIHCTIKPKQLISKLIDLTIPNDESRIVLDPFMGSGTTAIAAMEKNISYLGFEINNEYCEIANKRIQNYIELNRNKLF